ncbi:MAG: putative transport protein YdiK [Ignavibacteria bacterium]|nr:putative transport protein YdiK [Ignavibacteria bacterium]
MLNDKIVNNRKQIAQFILLMFITGLMLYICWLMLKPFISILLWSAILVIIFHPLYKKLMKKTGKHTLSALGTIAISLLTFIIPLFLISAAVVNELAGFTSITIEEINQIINDPGHGMLGRFYNYLNSFVNLGQILKPEDIKAFISKASEIILSASWYLVEGIFGMFVGILFAIFCMYYLFRDGENIVNDLPNILPVDNDQAEELILKTSGIINATIRGSLSVAVLQGTLAALIFWLLGIPSFILLGSLVMLFSLIPTGGTAFITVPVILILLASGEYVKAIVLAAYASLVIGMVDNFLLPKLIKNSTKMNEIFVFFSVVGGLQLFGILGIFMGPIILAIAFGLLTLFKGEKIRKDSVSIQ